MWNLDKEYFDQFKMPVMYPDETTNWKLPPLNGILLLSSTSFSVYISCIHCLMSLPYTDSDTASRGKADPVQQ